MALSSMVSAATVNARAAPARSLPPPSPSTESCDGASAVVSVIVDHAAAGKASSRAVV